MNELEALSILAGTPYLGSIKIRLLLQQFGSALETLKTTPDEVEGLPGFGPKIRDVWGWWRNDRSWRDDLDLADKHEICIIPFSSSDYPKRLLDIHDYPILLYVKGQLTKQDERSIAIVGTRHASIYGKEQAEAFGEDLASAGFTIVSGLQEASILPHMREPYKLAERSPSSDRVWQTFIPGKISPSPPKSLKMEQWSASSA